MDRLHWKSTWIGAPWSLDARRVFGVWSLQGRTEVWVMDRPDGQRKLEMIAFLLCDFSLTHVGVYLK